MRYARQAGCDTHARQLIPHAALLGDLAGCNAAGCAVLPSRAFMEILGEDDQRADTAVS